MTPATEAQVRKIRKFGSYARWFCGLAGVLLLIALVFSVWNILAGPTWEGFKVGLGPYTAKGDHMSTIELKVWSLIVVGLVFSILGLGLFHLERLFRHLAAGRIYTRENVQHIRQVGILALAMAVFQLVLPAASFALVETGFIDRTLVTPAAEGTSGSLLLGPASLAAFVMPALVLLVSWIMDVGRQTSDDAEAMRREADLVI